MTTAIPSYKEEQMESITAVLGLLVALSAASERLVEIFKGFSSFLDEKQEGNKERWRRLILHVLAGAAGVLTAWAAYPVIPSELRPSSVPVVSVLALGLLASGGSGLWNALLTWALEVKNAREATARTLEAQAHLVDDLTKNLQGNMQTTDGTRELLTTLVAMRRA
jgi:hypothetical protein